MINEDIAPYQNPVINETILSTAPNASTGYYGDNQPVKAAIVATNNEKPLAPPPLGSLAPFTPYSNFNNYGMNAYNFNSNCGSFPSIFGNTFSNSYGLYGGAGFNSRFGNMNAQNFIDPEARFIHLAEASARPAFETIESLVMVINNIASMLDSTYFALTSSFRAILRVTANIGRLSNVFTQFWHSFAVIRKLNWLYRKLLYRLRISKQNPNAQLFKEAFDESVNKNDLNLGNATRKILPRQNQSPWPVMAFITFVLTAPYIIIKLMKTVISSSKEDVLRPHEWNNPIRTTVLYDFQARNSSELSVNAGSVITVAPREVQKSLGLLSTGFAIATIDGYQVGLIPIKYIKNVEKLHIDESSIKSTESYQKTTKVVDIGINKETANCETSELIKQASEVNDVETV